MAELTVYEGVRAIAKASRDNYKVTSPLTGNEVILERDVDFGVIKGTKQPGLYKSGAEKIVSAYGLFVHFKVESKVENGLTVTGDDEKAKPFFFYNVLCELVRVGNNGEEYVFSSGYGSANTSEKRNGWNSPYDSANSTLKMAQKRALVQAALSVSGLSSLFSQDIENESFMQNYDELNKALKTGTITIQQGRKIFALGNKLGMSRNAVMEKLKEWGYPDIKKITNDQLDDIFEKLNALKEGDNGTGA